MQPQLQQQEVANLRKAFKNGADWFHWIGALSILNALLGVSGSTAQFVIGLGVTDVVSSYQMSYFSSIPFAPLLATVIVASGFFFFGVHAGKNEGWSFTLGMLLYALDGVLALKVSVLTALFHLYALYFLYQGYKAGKRLKELEADGPAGAELEHSGTSGTM